MPHELPSPLAHDPDTNLPDLSELLVAIEKTLTQERVDKLKTSLPSQSS